MYKWMWNALGWLVLCIVLPILVVYGGLFSFSREVPDVSGMSEARALAELEKAGLRGYLRYEYNPEIPKGYAIGTFYDPGTRRWPNAEIRLSVSLGVEYTEMPQLIGKTREEAQSLLSGEGLITALELEYSEREENGRVIDQSVRAGSLVSRGSTILITVGKGGKTTMAQVPDLRNLHVSQAEKMLERLGFANHQVHMVGGNQTQNTVVSQDPAPGSFIPVTETMVLKVCRGAAWMKVPELGSLPLETAQAEAEQVGFKLSVRYEYSDLIPSGRVISQEPAAETEISQGSSITVTVSAGPGVLGTSPSNALNFGVVTSQGDWVYYTNFNGNFYLCKMRRDGTEKQVLLRESVDRLNVVGDWIYFASLKKIGGQYEGLCKIRTDGTGRTRLRQGYYSWVYVENDWIYFLESGILQRIKTDGAGYSALTKNPIKEPVVTENGIYYLAGNSGTLWFMNKDGSNSKSMSQAGFYKLAYEDGMLYALRSNGILRMDVCSGECISRDFPQSQLQLLALEDGWLYYRKFSTVIGGIAGYYRIRWDLTEETKILDLQKYSNVNQYIAVEGGWLYFPNALDHDYLYRVKNDGSALERVCQ